MNESSPFPSLHPGDTIGVMAPSSVVDKDDIERSKALLEERGFTVFIHPQTYEINNQSAGTHLQKALAFQGLWQRKDIKAIWAAGGGNRALHLLDYINFKKLADTPKLLIGFSDVTALLNAVHAHTGIPTLHGPVFKTLHKQENIEDILQAIQGTIPPLSLEKAEIIQEGRAQAPLIGGNLSVFQYLPQILPDSSFYEGRILLLEECNEERSKVDRMILHLKQTGVLHALAGLVFGQFTNMQDTGRPFGFTLEDIVREHTDGLNIPVLMNAPFGHYEASAPFPIGKTGTLDTTAQTIVF